MAISLNSMNGFDTIYFSVSILSGHMSRMSRATLLCDIGVETVGRSISINNVPCSLQAGHIPDAGSAPTVGMLGSLFKDHQLGQLGMISSDTDTDTESDSMLNAECCRAAATISTWLTDWLTLVDLTQLIWDYSHRLWTWPDLEPGAWVFNFSIEKLVRQTDSRFENFALLFLLRGIDSSPQGKDLFVVEEFSTENPGSAFSIICSSTVQVHTVHKLYMPLPLPLPLLTLCFCFQVRPWVWVWLTAWIVFFMLQSLVLSL